MEVVRDNYFNISNCVYDFAALHSGGFNFHCWLEYILKGYFRHKTRAISSFPDRACYNRMAEGKVSNVNAPNAIFNVILVKKCVISSCFFLEIWPLIALHPKFYLAGLYIRDKTSPDTFEGNSFNSFFAFMAYLCPPLPFFGFKGSQNYERGIFVIIKHFGWVHRGVSSHDDKK